MSHFSSVDNSPSPDSLVEYLDRTAAGLTAMKHYVAAAARRAVDDGLVLDIGCGAGHDLALLAKVGVSGLGVDPSAAMLGAARDRLAAAAAAVRLAGADGAALPFRDGSAAGCRVERVLIHVESPDAVLREIGRVVKTGGFLAVFEPDWSTLQFGGDHEDRLVAPLLLGVRHPDIGGRLVELVEGHGFRVLDLVSEHSFGYQLADLPLKLGVQLERAVGAARIDRRRASEWLERQELLDRAGDFRASWTKVLVVAQKRSAPASPD